MEIMAVKSSDHAHRKRPWVARRRRNGIEYYLGRFRTREEAEQAEEAFEVIWPKNWGWNKGLRRGVDYAYHS